MKDRKEKKKYPLLSVRITLVQESYLDRESKDRGLTVPAYVKAVLFPFPLVGEK